ncbi:MAG: glycosyltransferase family 2 protein [Elusimicrobia bacterium]|nr:glycosyltransferase family 2 protein [Elusimicrobiota bacterium]
MSLTIIVVSYNSSKYLKNCLESVISLKDNIEKEIIVVDNASSDGSAELVRTFYPSVKLIENKKNHGFAKANNIGIMAAKNNFIMFLNPDIIVHGNTISKMTDFLKNTADAGIVGPKLLNPDGSLQLSCRTFYTLRTVLLRRTFLGRIHLFNESLRQHLMSDWDHNSIREVNWMLAACLLSRREILKKVGYFDERYRLYFEDVDLCRRIKDAGYKVYYYPEVTVVHHHQRESAKIFSKKAVWHIQSAIRFFNKFGWKF